MLTNKKNLILRSDKNIFVNEIFELLNKLEDKKSNMDSKYTKLISVLIMVHGTDDKDTAPSAQNDTYFAKVA